MKFILELLFGCLLSVGAMSQETVVSDGNAQERKLEPFTSVSIRGGMIAYIAQGSSSAVAVSANEAADVKRILTEVRNGTLYISFNNDGLSSWKGNRKLKAYITISQMQSLEVQGGSIVKTVDKLTLAEPRLQIEGGSIVDLRMSGANCKVNLQGGSILTLEGEVATFTGSIEGGSILKASDYKTTDTELEVHGGSIASFEVSRKLRLVANGGSVVNVDGYPTDLQVDKNGGSVVSVNRKKDR